MQPIPTSADGDLTGGQQRGTMGPKTTEGRTILMDHEKRKALAAAFKQKKVSGGIHLVENTATGRCLLLPTPNLDGAENRFAFARKTHFPPHPKLYDWGDGSAFTITLLDTLEKEEDWDEYRFRRALRELAALWQEKLSPREWY